MALNFAKWAMAAVLCSFVVAHAVPLENLKWNILPNENAIEVIMLEILGSPLPCVVLVSIVYRVCHCLQVKEIPLHELEKGYAEAVKMDAAQQIFNAKFDEARHREIRKRHLGHLTNELSFLETASRAKKVHLALFIRS